MKQCNKCLKVKDDSAFTRRKESKDGLNGTCKECRAKAEKERRIALKGEYIETYRKSREKNKAKDADQRERELYKKYPDGLIRCYCCGEMKPFSGYYKKATETYGLSRICKECSKSKNKDYVNKNRDNISESSKKRYIKNGGDKKNRLSTIREIYLQNGKKRCPVCGQILSTDLFYASCASYDGFYYCCKKCRKEQSTKWVINNSDKRNNICRKYRENHKYYKRDRMEEDDRFRTDMLLRSRFKNWITRSGCKKNYSMESMTGCSRENLILKLKLDGYVPGKHHIDHIIPLSIFSLDSNIEIKAAWNKNNLQPLTPKENLKKGSSIPSNWEETLLKIEEDLGSNLQCIRSRILSMLTKH